MAKKANWTQPECDLLEKMRNEGWSYKIISKAITKFGTKRTDSACQAQFDRMRGVKEDKPTKPKMVRLRTDKQSVASRLVLSESRKFHPDPIPKRKVMDRHYKGSFEL